MEQWILALRVETLVEKPIMYLLDHCSRKDSLSIKNTDQYFGGLFEVDSINNRSGFAAMMASLTPFYLYCEDTKKRNLINKFIIKYNFIPTLNSKEYWEVLKDAADDFEELLNELEIVQP